MIQKERISHMLSLFLPCEQNNYRARLLSTPALIILAVFLFLFNTVAGTIPVQAVSAAIGAEDLLTLHNEERRKANLPPLRINAELMDSAQQKAEAMLELNCWSHYCPPDVEPWTFFTEAGYDYLYAGENLAEGYFNNEDVMVAWMNSPTHEENIVKPEYEEIGFGIVQGNYQGKENNIIIVVHFGTEMQHIGNTLPVTTIAELPKPEILEPRTGAVLGTNEVTISGTAPEATQVTIYNHSQEWITADAGQGIFTYRATQLPEAKYEITARSHIGARTSGLSDQVDFTVDLTPDQIQAEEFTVLQTADPTRVKLALSNSDLSDLNLSIDAEIFSFTRETDSLWTVVIPRSLLRSDTLMLLSTKDLAGNIWSGIIDPQPIITKTANLPTSPTQDRVISSTAKTQVNIVSLILLVGLFGLDFLMLAKTGITRAGSKSHLHVAILLIVAIIALTGTFAGEVGTGLTA
jgi:uncharacterized protein YkwD